MLPRQLRIISKQSPLDLVGLAGCACKEAGSKWGWTLALDVPWAGSDRVHGGREQGGCSGRIGCTLRPAALGCGVLAWGLLLRGIHSTTLTWQHHAQGRVPGTWCPHISLEILISLDLPYQWDNGRSLDLPRSSCPLSHQSTRTFSRGH